MLRANRVRWWSAGYPESHDGLFIYLFIFYGSQITELSWLRVSPSTKRTNNSTALSTFDVLEQDIQPGVYLCVYLPAFLRAETQILTCCSAASPVFVFDNYQEEWFSRQGEREGAERCCPSPVVYSFSYLWHILDKDITTVMKRWYGADVCPLVDFRSTVAEKIGETLNLMDLMWLYFWKNATNHIYDVCQFKKYNFSGQ